MHVFRLDVESHDSELLGRRDSVDGLLKNLSLTTATVVPNTIFEAIGSLSSIAAANPASILDLAENLITAGLAADNIGDVLDFVRGVATGQNSMNNTNAREPE